MLAADYVAAAGGPTSGSNNTTAKLDLCVQGTAALTPNMAVGNGNEMGFAGTSTAQTASVLGTNTNGVAEFEIFN